MKLRSIAVILGLLLLTAVVHETEAVTYYIGPFDDSTPKDDGECGLGKGSRSRYPCKTLEHWNANRRDILNPGDVVRLAVGLDNTDIDTTSRCILLDAYASGVTYEGRTSADAPLPVGTRVLVDLQHASPSNHIPANICFGYAVSRKHLTEYPALDEYGDVTVRGLEFRKPPVGGILIDTEDTCCDSQQPPCPAPSFVPENIVFDNIKIWGVQQVEPDDGGGSAVIGRFCNRHTIEDADCASGGRTVKDVTIRDSEFVDNKGFPGGINLACMDTALIENVTVDNVCGLTGGDCAECNNGCSASTLCADCPMCAECRDDECFGCISCNDCPKCCDARNPCCNDLDGIVGSGAINVTIRNSRVSRVGEDGIDIGGHPIGKSRLWVVEGNVVHDSPNANYKVSGGRSIDMRNNMSWGYGDGYHSYSCPKDVRVHNNTFWNEGHGAFLYYFQNDSEFVNNIFRSGSSSPYAVGVDTASTNDTVLWENNIVIHGDQTANVAFTEEPFWGPVNAPDCRGQGEFNCTIGVNPPLGLGETCSSSVQSDPDYLINELPAFRSANWFGLTSGDGDVWGQTPDFVGATVTTAEDLQLEESDTVARDAAQSLLASFDTDYFGNGRPEYESWDIGAHEYNFACPQYCQPAPSGPLFCVSLDTQITHCMDGGQFYECMPGDTISESTCDCKGNVGSLSYFCE